MTTILRRLPFSTKADETVVQGERISIRPYQIIIWISLTNPNTKELHPATPRFPVILDTGHNHNLSIHESQLTRWTTDDFPSPSRRTAIRDRGFSVALRLAKIWLFSNLRGTRDHLAERTPLALEIPEGIAIYPSESDFPRLPILGLRVLVKNRLHLTIDPDRCEVTLRRTGWRTRLLDWL